MREFESRDAASFDFAEVLYPKADWVATVTINRPHNYNAYRTPALQELAAAFQDASWDDNVAVVVFTSVGDKAFCTGGDVKEYQVGMTPDYGAAQKLYVLRGYVPDGNGLYYMGRPTQYGQTLKVDDNLALYLTKELR